MKKMYKIINKILFPLCMFLLFTSAMWLIGMLFFGTSEEQFKRDMEALNAKSISNYNNLINSSE